MQPGEFYLCLEASQETQKSRDYRVAYWISVLLSPYCKEPLKIKNLVEPLWVSPAEKKRKILEDRKFLIKEFDLEGKVK